MNGLRQHWMAIYYMVLGLWSGQSGINTGNETKVILGFICLCTASILVEIKRK